MAKVGKNQSKGSGRGRAGGGKGPPQDHGLGGWVVHWLNGLAVTGLKLVCMVVPF